MICLHKFNKEVIFLFAFPEAGNKYGGKIPAVGHRDHPLKKHKYSANLGVVRHDMPQSEAKRFLPPDSYIWRNNKDGAWCAHLRPHRRHSESFKSHAGDSTAAMKAAVIFVWRHWLDDHCLPDSHCHMKDLLK